LTASPKAALVVQLAARLEAERAAAASSVASAHHAATDAEARPENKYDTRALEASYLAEAQSARLASLQEAIARLARMPLRAFTEDDPAQLSALVEVEADGETSWLFLTEVGAGHELVGPAQLARGAGAKVRAVTVLSPLGRALVGARVGDAVAVRLGGETRTYEVISVQ
jgi:transcription elongation GreA/GreB family factor